MSLCIGIDAVNLASGGARLHLSKLIELGRPSDHGIDRVVVWGRQGLLGALPSRPWLELRSRDPIESGGLIARSLWQVRRLGAEAQAAGVDLLFVPGGTMLSRFPRTVTMFRNMLPFDRREIARYGISPAAARLHLLRQIQAAGMNTSTATIFLSTFARDAAAQMGVNPPRHAVIAHGVDTAFLAPPRPPRPLTSGADAEPLHIAYVSQVDLYKHQWNVVEAVARLRAEGLPLHLDLYGGAHRQGGARLESALARHDPGRSFVTWHREVAHEALAAQVRAADLGIFASTCENLPNALLEMMAAGLPLACSARQPMRAIVGGGAVLFEPEDVEETIGALRRLATDPDLRSRLAAEAHARAEAYSWQTCADQTWAFLASVAAEGAHHR